MVYSALNELNQSISGCQNEFESVFDINTTTSTADFDLVCGQCLNDATQAYVSTNFEATCQEYLNDEEVSSTYVGYNALNNAVCLKVNNEYCWQSFGVLSAELGGSDDIFSFTNEQLDGLCSPCARRVFIAYASDFATEAEEDESFDLETILISLDILCERNAANEYCIQGFNGIGDIFSSEDPTPAQLDTFCDPCNQRILNAIFGLSADNDTDLSEFGTFFELLCQKDGDEYCSIKLSGLENDPAIQNCIPADEDAEISCDLLSCFQSAGGCCLTGYFDLITADTGLTAESCNLNLEFCSSSSVTTTFVMSNLKYSYYTSNQAEMDSFLTEVAAYNLGVQPDQISSVEVTETADGALQMTVNVISNTPGYDAVATEELDTVQSDGAVRVPPTVTVPSTLAADGTIDSTQSAFAAGVTGTSVTTQGTDSAAATNTLSLASAVIALASAIVISA